jgi:hypothetical protein
MDFRARMSSDLNPAEDCIAAIESSSPVSFSLSDVSSSDFNYENNDNNDNLSQSGLSTTGKLLEPLPSSTVDVEILSGSSNMVKPFVCDRCSRSFEKQHQLK